MPDDILDNSEDAIDTFMSKVEQNLASIIEMVRPLPEHINSLVSDVAELKLLSAVKEVPETVKDETEKAGDLLSDTGETAGSAVGTVPAVATDVIEDVGSVGNTTKEGTKSVFKRKAFRKR